MTVPHAPAADWQRAMARLAAGLPPSGDMLTRSWRVSGRLSLLSCTLSLCCPALLPWRRPLQEALLRAGRRLPESYGVCSPAQKLMHASGSCTVCGVYIMLATYNGAIAGVRRLPLALRDQAGVP